MHELRDKPEATAEQVKIQAVRQGYHLVAANAGTGKTHTIAELVAGIYCEEERRMFPLTPPGEHVTGNDQLVILKQICAITFTRDAAKELDDRIYSRLAEMSIAPAMDPWGTRHRVCRTIDSYVQSWMRRGYVIRKLLRVDPDMAGSLREKAGKLPEETRLALKEEGQGDAMVGFFRLWPWLRGDNVDNLIFDAIHRSEEDAIEGLEPAAWQDEFDAFLGELPHPPGVRGSDERKAWGTQFWEPKIEAWKAYQRDISGLNDRFKRGELAGDPRFQEHHLNLKVWEDQMGARKEFFSILEIARSRGYHPVRSPEKLAALAVLQEIAASEHWDDFVHFHNFALQFYATKLRYGVMDHTDFLIACVDTFEQHEDLVERDREYPRYGIRSKYVLYDEVQDNSISNNRLFDVLRAKPGIPYLAVAVGDPKQAIYAFRGACTFGFGQMLEKMKRQTPENIHHLTRSFRSLTAIVALGNECVMTLPDYRKTVQPSNTAYEEAGEVVMAPPISDEVAESQWVLDRVRRILVTTKESVMVLHRNNLREHPVVPGLKALGEEYGKRLHVLTIHRAKGLEGDHVFLMGMTAMLMPDVRTEYNQMVNLLYVALTRARKAIYITAPYTLLKATPEGVLEPREVGPSPFILRIPSLCKLAECSGWPKFLLEKGAETTQTAADRLLSRIGGKDAYLRKQWRGLWPTIPVKDTEGDEYTDEVGSAAPDARTRFVTRRTIYEDGQLTIEAGPRLDEGVRERVWAKMRQAWLKNGQAPKLTRDEYIVALKNGWLERAESGRGSKITPKFVGELEAA